MKAVRTTSSKAFLESVFSDFCTLPIEAILKQELLCHGLSFSSDSLKINAGYKPKDYFIFSFDLVPIEQMNQNENLKAPDEIKIKGGDWGLKETIVSVRLNPRSPYCVCLDSGKLVLMADGMTLAEVEYHPLPEYYSMELKSGKRVAEITPVIEWGYLVYLTAYRMCQYHEQANPCLFCDISGNYRQQIKAGRQYTAVKEQNEIIESLHLVDKYCPESQALTITGGAIIDSLNEKSEASFYADIARCIEHNFENRWLLKAVVQAMEVEHCLLLKQAGINIYHPNYEVWGEEMFTKLCPGKQKQIGFKGWVERIIDAASIFGERYVIPNFVAGVELNKVCGFSSIEQAIDSTTAGLDYFMSRKIMPRFTTWCPEPYAALGPQPSAPLEYYCQLLLNFRQLFHQYNLPLPKGYGPAGVGKAVFSVSAFMDVL